MSTGNREWHVESLEAAPVWNGVRLHTLISQFGSNSLFHLRLEIQHQKKRRLSYSAKRAIRATYKLCRKMKGL
jgi:hypothetical protein